MQTNLWLRFCSAFFPLSPREGREVYSVGHFLTHPHLSPGDDASFLCEQPWPAALEGFEDVTQSKQNVALSQRLRASSWVCGISEGSKNSVPNLISDFESGPRNPSDHTTGMVGKK